MQDNNHISDSNKPQENEYLSENTKKIRSNKKGSIRFSPLLIVLCLTVIFSGLAYFLPVISSNIMAKKAYNLYLFNKEETSQKIKDQINRIIDNYVEEKYHFGNTVKIEVEDTKELSSIDVLEVSYTAYVEEKGADNSAHLTVWQAITGRGTYKVDLSMAEILTDVNRMKVIINAPKPVLEIYGIDPQDKEILFKKNDIDIDFFDNENQLISDIDSRLEELAINECKDKLSSNASYYERAEKSAANLIEQFIKSLNPDLPELSVEVYFY